MPRAFHRFIAFTFTVLFTNESFYVILPRSWGGKKSYQLKIQFYRIYDD